MDLRCIKNDLRGKERGRQGREVGGIERGQEDGETDDSFRFCY